MARSIAAVALMVIEVETRSSGMPVQQQAHVVQGVDRHPDLAHFTRRHRMVGVVTHLGGEIEGHREPGLSVLEEVLEPAVGLGGVAEAGVLPHGPHAAPVHGGVDAASERRLARFAEIGSRDRSRGDPRDRRSSSGNPRAASRLHCGGPEHDHHRALLHDVAGLHPDLLDLPSAHGGKIVLHLHRLDDGHRLARLHHLSHLH